MGQRMGPLLPLPAAPPILLPGGPTSRKMGEESSPPPAAAESQVAEVRKEDLARPACPRGLWEENGSGKVGAGAQPAQIQDGATLAGSPMSWGMALGVSDAG